MSFTRRTFLIGAGSGLSVLVLTACVPQTTEKPTPSPTRVTDAGVPAPAAMERSGWAADSFARGSVSYTAVGSTLQHREDLGEPLLDRVFFAGEATSTEAPGTVRGALRSGAIAAASVADVAGTGDNIAIIGAGAAGAEAARILTLRGYNVSVMEARDRVGGRIHSYKTDAWPFAIELGAWRLAPTADSELLENLSRAGVLSVALGTVEGQTVYRSATGESGTDPVSTTAVSAALAWAQQQSRDVSLATAIEDSGARETATATTAGELAGADLLDQRLANLATIYGAGADELSSWFTPDVTEPPNLVTGGFSSVIAQSLDGVKTYLSTAVLGIAYTDDGVSLRLGTGESLGVDRVIVTVPLGVLQDDSIDFDPLLPFSHRTAIAALGMGTVNTVWLRFERPFWTTDAVAWNLVGTDDAITTWINLEPLTGEPILVGVVGGEAAELIEELDDDALIESVIRTLAPFAG